jgi:hypothetical protein
MIGILPWVTAKGIPTIVDDMVVFAILMSFLARMNVAIDVGGGPMISKLWLF